MKLTTNCVGSMEHDEENGNLLNFIVLSDKRKNLLILLRDGPKTLDDVKNYIKDTSSGIIPQIRKMEEKHLVYERDRRYILTEIGEVLSEYLCNFEEIARVFSENRKFWSEHKISGIPLEFRLRLNELGKSEIIKSTPTDILRPHNEYIKNLLNAKWMKGVASVLHPNYPQYVFDMAERGAHVSVIVTGELLKKLKEEHMAELQKGLGCKNVSLMVSDEKIEVCFAVTDFFLSVRLFLMDGTYDFYQNILSFDKSGLKWGEELFNYYERRSRRVEL